jgi:hypothetical protein
MPTVTGSFSGSTTSQTIATLNDMPYHEMRLATISGIQKTSDPMWNDARITYCDTADLTAGNGPHRGYFTNTHPNGDQDFGSFEGMVRTTDGNVTLEGNWKYTGGTGQFKGISGGGTYKGRLTSPTEVENNWEGKYELAGQTQTRPSQSAATQSAASLTGAA